MGFRALLDRELHCGFLTFSGNCGFHTGMRDIRSTSTLRRPGYLQAVYIPQADLTLN